ncbi:MAG: F0F1 ATP synthase subunit gamma [Oceanospirillales bacterium]|nr:F0F1 ATP synthase subunit gamma [Oceanospirillales bacterium]
MSHSSADLRRQIDSATDLQAVVRTMKALAASSINQYEQAVQALADYAHSVELGLSVCLRHVASKHPLGLETLSGTTAPAGVVVFGSDQGLVGQFNDVVANHALQALADQSPRPLVWAVGERVHARLADAGLPPAGDFGVPGSVQAITLLVGQILAESEARISRGEISGLRLFYNQPTPATTYSPTSQRLLPLDAHWYQQLAQQQWPTGNLPEVLGAGTPTLQALIREYLFVSLFRACAESLASENASRLSAMQRADTNIGERLEILSMRFHRERQDGIDEELFDVIAGFEALPKR